MNDNIVLIGMPSCGKSTLGKMLARDWGYTFVDTDDVIKERNGCELQEIIDNEGLEEFNRREEEAICSVNGSHLVIATGGSAVYSPRSMEHLRSIGTVVYMEITFHTLLLRVGDPRIRGVAIPDGFTFKDLYNQRIPLYRQYAHITLSAREKESRTASLQRLKTLLEEK